MAKRVEALVAQRVEAELERRKEEIEAEVMRRVEEAKRALEKEMMEEMERQRAAELNAQAIKEVKCDTSGCLRAVMACLIPLSSQCRQAGSHDLCAHHLGDISQAETRVTVTCLTLTLLTCHSPHTITSLVRIASRYSVYGRYSFPINLEVSVILYHLIKPLFTLHEGICVRR